MSMALQTDFSQNPVAGYAGTLDSGPSVKWTAKNAESSASIPFGMPVAFKPSGATSDQDVTIPANSTDNLMGILFRSDAYSMAWTDKFGTHGALDATGVVAGQLMDIARSGRILVTCTTGCVPGDRLYVSYSAGSTYSAAGQLGNAAEASHTIDATTKGEWKSTAAAGGLAWLEFDFLNK